MPDPLTMAAVAAPVIGGLFGKSGQSSANKTNLKIAKDQMAFQERMSNTAHQREINDLKQAGLNPILSAKLGGASSPAGASAKMENENAQLAENVKNLTNSAQAAKLLSHQVDNAKETNFQIQAQTAKTMAETDNIRQNIGIADPMSQMMQMLSQFITSGKDLGNMAKERKNWPKFFPPSKHPSGKPPSKPFEGFKMKKDKPPSKSKNDWRKNTHPSFRDLRGKGAY